MQANGPTVPFVDRLVALFLIAAGALVIAGSAVYAAPLMLEQGWQSPRALLFLSSTSAALALGDRATVGILSRLRH